MPHDVFISYSSRDKPVANAVCAKLEARNIRCWIAPRDILPGIEYGEALVNAITECQVVALVLSKQALQSPQVRREIERAVTKGKTIVTLRIEDITPTGAMEFALSNTHWLDALTPPLESHIIRLVDAIQRLINKNWPSTGPSPSRVQVEETLYSNIKKKLHYVFGDHRSRKQATQTRGAATGVFRVWRVLREFSPVRHFRDGSPWERCLFVFIVACLAFLFFIVSLAFPMLVEMLPVVSTAAQG